MKRWEYVEKPRGSGSYVWEYIGWPPNLGGRRDIPSTALFHHSVISRMRLSPDRANYRPKFYEPSNPLWCQVDGSDQPVKPTVEAAQRPKLIKRMLSELARQYHAKHGGDHDVETQHLVKPKICFVHVEELTKGSAAVEGHTLPVGPEEWDNIYKVALESN